MRVVALISILGVLLAPLHALAEPTSAQSERDRIRALEQHVAALAADLASLKASSPAMRSRPSRAQASARLALLGYVHPGFGALGMVPPIFGARITGGGSVTSAGLPDPYVPVDGTMNVTGVIAASSSISGTTIISTGDVRFNRWVDSSNSYVVAQAAGAAGRLDSTATDGATAIAFRLSANADYTTAGAKLLSVGDNAGTSYAEKAFIEFDGDYSSVGDIILGSGRGIFGATGADRQFQTGTTATFGAIVRSYTSDGANTAVKIAAATDLTNASAKIVTFGDNDTAAYAEKVYIDKDGDIVDADGTMVLGGTSEIYTFTPVITGHTTDGGAETWRISGTNGITTPGPVASGGTINGIEIDYTAADFVATDTTPLDVTGISFTLDINDVYAISCTGRAWGALATAGIQVGLDVPASATVSAVCSSITTEQTRSFNTDDGFCAYTASFIAPGAPYTMEAVVTMSSTAGDTKLRLRSETTDDATLGAGYKCEAKKLVNN